MKTFLLSSKFFLLSFLAIQLSLCSSDDDNTSVEEIAFQPITLDLTNVDITTQDTTFDLQGYQFEVLGAQSNDLGYQGILLGSFNGELSSLILNLVDVEGVSAISVSLFNNCSACLDIQVLNGNQVVQEIKGTELESGENVVPISINSDIMGLRIASAEAIVNSIRLE